MTSKIIFSGLVATGAMSIMMMIAPHIGMAEMNIPLMLSDMTNTHIAVGWLMHFAFGILFALIYARYFNNWLRKIKNNFFRGLIYGVFVFILAEIILPMLMKMMMTSEMPSEDNSGMNMFFTSAMVGHLIYGGVLGLFFDSSPSKS
jgi:uncharacterized membrane protein YagU involved in acid resistance